MREMIPVLIVAIVMIAVVFKYRYRYLGNQAGQSPEAASDNRQLREEVQELKERIKVLERIAVDKENALAKEIDSLRDR